MGNTWQEEFNAGESKRPSEYKDYETCVDALSEGPCKGIGLEGDPSTSDKITAGSYGSFPAPVSKKTGEYVVTGERETEEGETETSEEIAEDVIGDSLSGGHGVKQATPEEKREIEETMGTRKETLKHVSQEQTETNDKTPESTTVKNAVKDKNWEKARKLWVEKHDWGKDYCTGVGSGDPICGNHKAFCNSPLAGDPGAGEGNFAKSCWQEPALGGYRNPDLNVIAEEWANGVPLTSAQENQMERFISTFQSRATSTIGGKSAVPITKFVVENNSSKNLKDMAKQMIREEGYWDPDYFQGWIKYKAAKEAAKTKTGKETLQKLTVPGEPLYRVLNGEKGWEHYRAAVNFPGGIYGHAELAPSNLDPFSGGFQHHERTGKTLDPFDRIEFERNLEDGHVRLPNTRKGLRKLGRKFDQIREHNTFVGDFEDELAEEYGKDALRTYLNFKKAVDEEYGFSSITIGRIASGASETGQDVAGITEREQHGLGPQNLTEREERILGEQAPEATEGTKTTGETGGGLFSGLFGGGKETGGGEVTPGGTSLQSMTQGQPPQEGGAGGTKPQGITDIVTNNPIKTLGAAGILTYFLTK